MRVQGPDPNAHPGPLTRAAETAVPNPSTRAGTPDSSEFVDLSGARFSVISRMVEQLTGRPVEFPSSVPDGSGPPPLDMAEMIEIRRLVADARAGTGTYPAEWIPPEATPPEVDVHM